MADNTKASFIPPMLLVRREKLPEGENWLYELKFDAYRSIAFKTGGKVYLRSRNDNDFNSSYPGIVKALADLPFRSVANWAHMSLLILGS
jgi:bifunctional non-homologous end joining protein LigD